jgi:hypothetical protein
MLLLEYFSTYFLKHPTHGKPSQIKFSALITSVYNIAHTFARRAVLRKLMESVVYFDLHVDEHIVLDQNEKKVSYLMLIPNSIEIG